MPASPESGPRSRIATRARYEDNVFVNCPFDEGYRPMFDAIVFAVHACGFYARSALEFEDSAENRLDKIMRIIEACRFGIHDISRTELNTAGLPRFNVPLELGLFLGCRRYGTARDRKKICLVLDVERDRYQAFMSDISGQDGPRQEGTSGGRSGGSATGSGPPPAGGRSPEVPRSSEGSSCSDRSSRRWPNARNSPWTS